MKTEQELSESMVVTEFYSPDFKIILDLGSAAFVAAMVWALFEIVWRKSGVVDIRPDDFGGFDVSSWRNPRQILAKSYPLIERMASRFFLAMKDSGVDSGEYTGEQFLHFMQDTYHLGPC